MENEITTTEIEVKKEPQVTSARGANSRSDKEWEELHQKKILKKVKEAREEFDKKIPIFKEFKDFLEEYKVIGLAVAVIMGLGLNALVKSLVDNIIMPIITPFIPGGGWQTATLKLGPIVLGWGPFLSALIYFLILAWAVFLIVRYMFGKKKASDLK